RNGAHGLLCSTPENRALFCSVRGILERLARPVRCQQTLWRGSGTHEVRIALAYLLDFPSPRRRVITRSAAPPGNCSTSPSGHLISTTSNVVDGPSPKCDTGELLLR